MTNSIIINKGSEFYEIPVPKELLKNFGVCFVLNLNKNTNAKITRETSTKIEPKQFFMYNSDIFKLYLERIIEMEILPDNFYMFIDQILYLIKSKNMIENVDDYWRNMILPREKK
jgi:hypothetical protein